MLQNHAVSKASDRSLLQALMRKNAGRDQPSEKKVSFHKYKCPVSLGDGLQEGGDAGR